MGSPHMLLYGKSESTVSRGVSLFWVLLCSVSKLDSTLATYIYIVLPYGVNNHTYVGVSVRDSR